MTAPNHVNQERAKSESPLVFLIFEFGTHHDQVNLKKNCNKTGCGQMRIEIGRNLCIVFLMSAKVLEKKTNKDKGASMTEF